MLTETSDRQLTTWASETFDPDGDRIMLAIQYATAIVAVLAAGFLSFLH